MAKTLKKWNGRSHGHLHKNCHYSVVAYSQKQAAELVAKGSGCSIGTSEIRVYYSSCWGTKMEEQVPNPTTPCLYVTDDRTGVIVEMYM
jgi:hypothetical protein